MLPNCDFCKGSKVCADCHGKGCSECLYDGRCIWCDGVGEEPEPLEEEDDAATSEADDGDRRFSWDHGKL